MVRKKTSLTHTQRGAALIIVVAIMTILLAIALTFFSITRLEVQTATNVVNAVRSDLLNDAGNAIAMAQLNQDLFAHPAATSNDFAFRSLFNGTWAAGKPWAWRDNVPLHGRGVPEVNWYRIQRNIGQALGVPNFALYAYFPKDDYRELLYMGPRTRPWLFVPRKQDSQPLQFLLFDPTVELRGLGPGDDPLNTSFNDYELYVSHQNPQDPTTTGPYLHPVLQSLGISFDYVDFDQMKSPDERPDFPYVTTEYYDPPVVNPLPSNDIPGVNDFADGNQYPQEQIDAFTDVDNDGDGLRDSIWLPIPKDLFFDHDGVDNNLDGSVDESNEPGTFVYWGGDDGLDNDGNGLVDEPAERKYFLTAPLPGLLLPVDIDGDGISGDKVTDERDGQVKPLMVKIPDTIYVEVLARDPMSGEIIQPETHTWVPLTADDVDALDNDYDLFANDFQAYVYVESNGNTNQSYEYASIKKDYFGGNLTLIPPLDDIQLPNNLLTVPDLRKIHVTLSGEPVCRLAGRMAVLVRDASSLLNLNIAGGHHFEPRFQNQQPPDPTHGGSSTNPNSGIIATFRRSLNEGVGTWELDTRILPNIGPGRSAEMWTYLTGRNTTNPLGAQDSDYIWDILTPGYGRTDDNGNAVLLALNHADDDGDGIIDNGFLPPFWSLSPLAQQVIKNEILLTSITDDDLRQSVQQEVQTFVKSYDRLGMLEGIDEPAELQRVRPLRNLIAEGIVPHQANDPKSLDKEDNDGNNVINEIGELGDKQLQAESDIMKAPGIKDGTFNDIKNYVTVHSLTKNVRYIPTDKGLRGLNRLNYNYATPQQIAVGLLVGGNLTPITAEPDPLRLHEGDYLDSRFVGKPYSGNVIEPTFTLPKTTNQATGLAGAPVFFDADTNAFADGLRQAMVHIRAPQGFLYGPAKFDPNDTSVVPAPTAFEFPADPVLEALQAAASIVDFRDADHARTVITTDVGDKNDPSALDPRQVVPLDQLLNLKEVDDWLKDIMGASRKTYEIVDRWWQALTRSPDQPEGQERRISYTVAGVESIRINEIMVRPVRRVEAETLANRNIFPVPENGDPVVTKVSSVWPANFDPSPLTQPININNNIINVPILPTLNVYRNARKITGTPIPPFGLNLVCENPCVDPTSPECFRFRCDGDFIGDRTVLPSKPATPDRPSKRSRAGVIHVPAGYIAEFVIRQPYISAIGTEWEKQPPSALPPGRYYLIANINLGNESGNTFRYSIKYVAVDDNNNEIAGQTILDDYCALEDPTERLGFLTNYFQKPVPAYPGAQPQNGDSLGKPAGDGFRLWFLDGTPTNNLSIPGYFLEKPEGGTFVSGVKTHTVHAPQALEFALCIAIYAETDLDIDYFDFSQEPDHEWVEIVNISDEPVDISGWKLEVGAPDVNGQPNPEKSVWKIPANTAPIEPGGAYLLAFNVFEFEEQSPTTDATIKPTIKRNGLGLARGSDSVQGRALSNVCTPPIPPRTLRGDRTQPLPVPPYNLFDGTQDPGDSDYEPRSVFDRADRPDDFVDINGDSINDILPPGKDVPAPWSRIIEMECEQWRRWDPANPLSAVLRIDDIKENNAVNPDAVSSDPLYLNNLLADLILRGGVFPNYPEHDWVDNDGDNGILTTDGVDNDLDGRIDEDDDDNNDHEGVDEGRGLQDYAGWRIGGAGSYGWGSLPVRTSGGDFGADPWLQNGTTTAYYLGMEGGDPCNGEFYGDPPDWKAFVERRWYPGDAVIVTLYTKEGLVADRVTYTEQDVINRAIDDIARSEYRAAGFALDNSSGPANDDNPCNIVCLHPGYTTFWLPNHMALDFYKSLERRSPFFTGDRFGTTNRWEATDGNYDDWAENPGWLLRRVDVTNAASGLFTVDRSEDNYYFVASNLPTEMNWVSPYYDNPNYFYNYPNYLEHLYQHARDASPLRMNFAHRLAANPRDQFPLSPDPDKNPNDEFPQRPEFTAILGKDRASLENKGWNFQYAHVQNHSLMSAGDLMRMPHEVHEYFLFSQAGQMEGLDYRMDPSGVNTIVKNDLEGNVMQSLHLRSVLFGQDENYQIRYAKRKDDERYFYTPQVLYGTMKNLLTGEPQRERAEPGFERPNLFVEAAEHFAPESVTLTVGQADFIPIRPNPYEFNRSNSKLQPPPNTDLDDFYGLLNWNGTQAPAVFAPIYLYALKNPDDVPPYLPPYADGSRADIISPNATIPLRYVFNRDFLFLKDGPFNPLMPATSNPERQILAPRNPLERRAVAYVAERRYRTPGQTMDLCGFGRDRAEALFVWDAEDGLENGEYLVYIGTVPSRFAQAYEETNEALANIGIDFSTQGLDGETLSPPDLPYFGDGAQILHDITPDKVAPLAVEIITDPPRTRRMAPSNLNTEEGEGEGEGCTLGTADPSNETGLTHPDYWNGTKYQPRSDGYIYYGGNTASAWKPFLVRVKDNFLALRIRNLGEPGQKAVLTHVVLTPRKYVPGKININTVENYVHREYEQNQYNYRLVNVLTALPGLLRKEGLLRKDPTEDMSFLLNSTTQTNVPLPSPDNLTSAGSDEGDAAKLSRTIMRLRPDRGDGRYYEKIGELVLDALGKPGKEANQLEYPLSAEQEPDEREQKPGGHFKDVYDRFRSIANLITTRSDIFEVLVTVQSGYGRDMNQDGKINYRSPEEFIVTGETKSRMVYERRTPSDRSDQRE